MPDISLDGDALHVLARASQDVALGAPETPSRAAALKRAVNALGALNLGSEIALAAVNAALSEAAFRRPPARRLLHRA
jgi:hypothetical protein